MGLMAVVLGRVLTGLEGSMLKVFLRFSLGACAVMLTGCEGVTLPVEEQKQASQSIVGGAPADIADWPWVASLRVYGFEQDCGATLIAEKWVLTAAHCNQPLNVVLGTAEPTSTSGRILRSVVRMIRHPDFRYVSSNDSYENDIALIELANPVTSIAPAVLNRDAGFPTGVPLAQAASSAQANARIAGWGYQFFGGSTSVFLREAAIPVLTNESCAVAHSSRYPIHGYQLCAGYLGGAVDSCQGDSGGPLAFDFGDKALVAGVVSFGTGCAIPGVPGVYTRVSSYIDWIASYVPGLKTYSAAATISVLYTL